jgi:glycosyltransferase involved in cell wall biosynthesis
VGIQTALDAVVQAERIVDALRHADDLAFEASRDGGPRTVRVLSGALTADDQLTAIAAVHALGRVVDQRSDDLLSRSLSSPRPFLVEHAAWVLASRRPLPGALPRLVRLVVAGGFTGMIAQRTLEQWSASAPDTVAVALESALLGTWSPEVRRTLVETLGLVRHPIATAPLLRLARDAGEPSAVRAAAVAALGERRGEAGVAAAVDEVTGADGVLGAVARLALVDLLTSPEPVAGPGGGPAGGGLTVGQLALHADIDPGLGRAGSGATGGIATLLVRLGDALIQADDGDAPAVDRVLTMSRGTADDTLADLAGMAGLAGTAGRRRGHRYGRVPLLPEPVAGADVWSYRVAARRGVRRLLRAVGGLDVLHLRMADVGSLVAAEVAYEADIPVVFTLAPDPPAVFHALDLAGRLDRRTFGEADLAEHYWFRTRLVQRLAGNAAHTVLFPRPDLADDLQRLLGIDVTARPERHTVVPEGIDLDLADAAVAEAAAHAAGDTPSPPLQQLRTLLETLPAERRGLPLVTSVGRLHRVKGMATLVRAWRRSALSERANLLVVGGDLAEPGPDEREQLARIDRLVPAAERTATGLLLPGHRANGTVARWLAATRTGVPGLAAPGGVYVCASVKEEFGLALLEAMAAGLLVVAPDGGGPATYVEDGVTGRLTRTWDPDRLAAAIADALDASLAERDPDRAVRSRGVVAERFTVAAMARTLAGVYGGVAVEHRRLADRLAATG